MNCSVWNFYLPVIPHLSSFSASIWPLGSCSSELWLDQMVGKSASPRSPAIMWIIFNSVKFPRLSLSKDDFFFVFVVGDSVFNHVLCFVIPKCICVLWKTNFHEFKPFSNIYIYIYNRYFLSSWMQKGIYIQNGFCCPWFQSFCWCNGVISPNWSQALRLYCVSELEREREWVSEWTDWVVFL